MNLTLFFFAAETHAPHWGYDHPALWGDLSADFKECKLGKEESPIDISTKATVKEKLPALGFNYKTGAAVVFNNGHTVQVNLIDGGPRNSRVEITHCCNFISTRPLHSFQKKTRQTSNADLELSRERYRMARGLAEGVNHD